MPRLNRARIREWLVDKDKTVRWLAGEAGMPAGVLANALCPSADPIRSARVRSLSRVMDVPEADLVASGEKSGDAGDDGPKEETTGPKRRENGGSGTGPKRPSGVAA